MLIMLIMPVRWLAAPQQAPRGDNSAQKSQARPRPPFHAFQHDRPGRDRVEDSPTGWWVTPYYFGIDQRPVALMIENHRSGLIWDVMRRCPDRLKNTRHGNFHYARRVARQDKKGGRYRRV